MSEPLRASRGGNEEPRPDLVPYEQATGNGSRTGHAARTRAWFHRTAPGTVSPAAAPPAEATPRPRPDEDYAAGKGHTRHAGTDARPAPGPANPAAPETPGRKPFRHLTWEEVEYSIKHDPDNLDWDEESYRFWKWDMAIDDDRQWDIAIGREPEIDEPEME
jgi:hypothetical protein